MIAEDLRSRFDFGLSTFCCKHEVDFAHAYTVSGRSKMTFDLPIRFGKCMVKIVKFVSFRSVSGFLVSCFTTIRKTKGVSTLNQAYPSERVVSLNIDSEDGVPTPLCHALQSHKVQEAKTSKNGRFLARFVVCLLTEQWRSRRGGGGGGGGGGVLRGLEHPPFPRIQSLS